MGVGVVYFILDVCIEDVSRVFYSMIRWFLVLEEERRDVGVDHVRGFLTSKVRLGWLHSSTSPTTCTLENRRAGIFS